MQQQHKGPRFKGAASSRKREVIGRIIRKAVILKIVK
jgi:hypothetical protein